LDRDGHSPAFIQALDAVDEKTFGEFARIEASFLQRGAPGRSRCGYGCKIDQR
jgi:hypothetical protein